MVIKQLPYLGPQEDCTLLQHIQSKIIKEITMINKSNSNNEQRRCDNCGKVGVIEKRITRIYGRGKDALIIENVPIMVCPHCGASYMEAKTLHEIERIKLHRKSFASPRPIDVAAFAL